MEASIELAEGRRASAEAALSDPANYRDDPKRIPELKAELATATAEIERLYGRWQELQDRAAT
jgi:ATP-binding cassette subfamily F protein uup